MNFAMTDIHGLEGTLNDGIAEARRQSGSEPSTIYIVGDIADGSDSGVQMYTSIMNQKEDDNPRIVLLAGNHEVMVYENLNMIRTRGITDNLIIMHKQDGRSQEELEKEFLDMCERLRKKLKENKNYDITQDEVYKKYFTNLKPVRDHGGQTTGLTTNELKFLKNHIYNDGARTIWDLIKMKDGQKDKLFKFFREIPLEVRLDDENGQYLLTHFGAIEGNLNGCKTLVEAYAKASGIPDRTNGPGWIVYEALNGTIGERSDIRRLKSAQKSKSILESEGRVTVCGHFPDGVVADAENGRLCLDGKCKGGGTDAATPLLNITTGEITYIGIRGIRNGRKMMNPLPDESYQSQKKAEVKDFFDTMRKKLKWKKPKRKVRTSAFRDVGASSDVGQKRKMFEILFGNSRDKGSIGNDIRSKQ